MRHVVTIRSPRGRVGCAVIAALGALFLGIVVYSDGPAEAVRTAPWPLLVAFGTWWLWAWPTLILAPGGVVARNHLRTISIPWHQLEECETNFGLYLHTASKRYYVAAAPTRGGLLQARRRTAPEPPVLDYARNIYPIIGAEPQIAARLVDAERHARLHPADRPRHSSDDQRRIAQQLRDKPIDARLDGDFPRRLTIRWNWPPLAITLFLLAGAILTTWAT